MKEVSNVRVLDFMKSTKLYKTYDCIQIKVSKDLKFLRKLIYKHMYKKTRLS